jgi:hypothetical protein
MAGLPLPNYPGGAPAPGSGAGGLGGILGAIGQIGLIPQYKQAMESQQISLEDQKLGLEAKKTDIAAAKQKASYDQATQRLNALQTIFKSNPDKWGKDPEFSKNYADTYRTITGGEAPTMPDGSLDPSIVKPSIEDLAQKNPKELARIQGLKPIDRKAALSVYAGVTPDMLTAPAIVTDEQKAKIAEVAAKTNHYIDVDAVAAKREEANGILARAKADELAGRKTVDTARAQQLMSDSNKLNAQAVNYSKMAEVAAKDADTKRMTAQKMMPRGGTAGVESAKALITGYQRLSGTMASVDAQVVKMVQDPQHDDNDPQYQTLLKQQTALRDQINQMQPEADSAQNYLISNLGYSQSLKAGSGASDVTVTNVGGGNFKGAPADAPSSTGPSGTVKYYNGSWRDKSGKPVQ